MAHRFPATLLASAFVAMSGLAGAQVSQLDGTALPTPTGGSETAVVTSRGFPADAVTLEGLFKYRGEMLDPVKSARTEPGLFSPTCGFSGELLLRGGSCKVAFGWYNAGEPTKIIPLVPADTGTAFMCTDGDFCPLATMNTTQTGQHTWTPKAFRADDIKGDPNYKGGLIGFALIGDMATQCKQTKYSEAAQNTVSTEFKKPWVTTLIYQSTANPEGFYVAFEDLAMTPESWKNAGPGSPSNDGDFNDFVYFINGLSCEGGGLPCEVPGSFGACSQGRTECSNGTVPGACRAVVKPGAERCDNVDNDCNGMVDDGNGLCAEGEVCDRGSCVPPCGSGEFRCPGGTTCVTGLCIDTACAAVMCPAGQRCAAGTCVNACDNVKCPGEQQCQLGRCVDLCKGVTCDTGKVCEKGLCVSDCKCRECAAGTTCQADGRCLDTACANKECPSGQVCKLGVCGDACAGVTCPLGGACVNGECQEPAASGGNPVPGAGGSGSASGGGLVIGGSNSVAGSSSNGNGSEDGAAANVKDPGCACSLIGPRGTDGLAGLLAALGVASYVARRRRARAA